MFVFNLRDNLIFLTEYFSSKDAQRFLSFSYDYEFSKIFYLAFVIRFKMQMIMFISGMSNLL